MAEMAFNSPRSPYSLPQQSGSLAMAQELAGTRNAPSLDALENARNKLSSKIGTSTLRETTADGVVWYLNEIGDSLAKVV